MITLDLAKHGALILAVIGFIVSLGVLFWRVNDVEKKHDKLDNKVAETAEDAKDQLQAEAQGINRRLNDQATMFSQLVSDQDERFKKEIDKIRTETRAEFHKIEGMIEEQRTSSSAQYETIRNKLEEMNNNVWQVKESLARMSGSQYPREQQR